MCKEGIVYCDFDGTLICGDIEVEWVRYLRQIHYFRWFHYTAAAVSIPVNRARRKMLRGSLMKSWTIGMDARKMSALLPDFYQQRKARLELNRDVLNLLRTYASSCRLILLTASDERLVRDYLSRTGLEALFDCVIGGISAPCGFFLRREPYGKGKCPFIDKSARSIGIANEWADTCYLRLCTEAYVIGGSPEQDSALLRLARKLKWKVI